VAGLSPSEAETVMKDIEGILQQVSRYHQLTEDQRLALHSRAGLARQQIADVVKILKKFGKAVDSSAEQ
jgi:hypothetical protein